MKKEMMRNVAGVILFYMLIVFGVLAVNARMEILNEVNSSVSLGN